MKKSVRILALALALVTVCFVFVACGKKLSGTYTADIWGSGVAMTFDGKEVKIAVTVLDKEVASRTATYEIKDDKISFEFADEEEVENTIAKKVLEAMEEPADFEEGDDYIKIDGFKYTKKAD